MNKIQQLPTKLRAWWRNLVKVIHAKFGLVTRQEHADMKAKLKWRNAEISRLTARLEIENTHLRQQNETLSKQLHELPFDFENLLTCYNITKLNALVYRIINDTRNNPSTVGYLQRWRERIENALTTLQNTGEEEIG